MLTIYLHRHPCSHIFQGRKVVWKIYTSGQCLHLENCLAKSGKLKCVFDFIMSEPEVPNLHVIQKWSRSFSKVLGRGESREINLGRYFFVLVLCLTARGHYMLNNRLLLYRHFVLYCQQTKRSTQTNRKKRVSYSYQQSIK